MTCNRKNVWRDKTPVNIVEVFFFSDLTMDHVVPQFCGGEKTWDNIVAAVKMQWKERS